MTTFAKPYDRPMPPRRVYEVALRALHVLAAALLVGLPLGVAFGGADARRAEWILWASLAVLVVGGMANLGALGNPPPHDTRWGRILTLKLLTLILLLGVSAARLGHTLAEDAAPRLWFGTSGLATIALVLAVVLAHG